MSDNAQALLIERQQQVLVARIKQSPMNPIGVAQVAALNALLDDMAADDSVRAIVIRGADPAESGRPTHFSVGANLKEADAAAEAGPKAFVAQRIALFNRIEAFEKPVIAAIEGYCLGGGLELAMSCHLRIASSMAQLGLPEIDLGAAPMWSGAARVLRLCGRGAALELLLRGQRVDASRALQMGLVNEVHEAAQFDQAVDALAQELAEKAPLAMAAIIRVINHSQDHDITAALDYELDAFSALAGTKDNIEGVTALFEKRKPVFVGE